MSLNYFFFVYNNVFIYLRLLIVCCIVSPLLLISIALSLHNKCIPMIIHYGSKALLWAIRIPVATQGSYDATHQPSIIVANHQSIIDIPLIAASLPAMPHQWLYKTQLDTIPCIGRLFKKIGIAVPQLSLTNGLQVLRKVCQKAEEYPYNFIVFPEGARFVDGFTHKFMPGFGFIAQKLSYKVIPIYLHNVGRVCPPGSFCIHYTPVKITIGPTFNLGSGESVQSFVERIQLWFSDQEKTCAIN